MNRILQFIAFLVDCVLPQDTISTITPEQFAEETKGAVLFREVYPDIVACFSYRDPLVRKVIVALKYRANRHAAVLLAPALGHTVIEELGERMRSPSDQCFIIPIPRSPDHTRRHGANQALLLAEEITKTIPQHVVLDPTLLTRTRKTISQTKTTNRAERFQNIAGVFAVRDSTIIRGARIILVDDVVTTGATMNEARRILLAAGAASVTGVAAAH